MPTNTFCINKRGPIDEGRVCHLLFASPFVKNTRPCFSMAVFESTALDSASGSVLSPEALSAHAKHAQLFSKQLRAPSYKPEPNLGPKPWFRKGPMYCCNFTGTHRPVSKKRNVNQLFGCKCKFCLFVYCLLKGIMYFFLTKKFFYFIYKCDTRSVCLGHWYPVYRKGPMALKLWRRKKIVSTKNVFEQNIITFCVVMAIYFDFALPNTKPTILLVALPHLCK